jgi:hypothetical protein
VCAWHSGCVELARDTCAPPAPRNRASTALKQPDVTLRIERGGNNANATRVSDGDDAKRQRQNNTLEAGTNPPDFEGFFLRRFSLPEHSPSAV